MLRKFANYLYGYQVSKQSLTNKCHFSLFLNRSVGENQKSLALGLNNIATSLLATMPAPIIYGRIIDSTCKLMSSNYADSGGFCLKYDSTRFRYLLHGVTIGFIFIGLLFVLFVLIQSKKSNAQKEVEVDENNEEMGQELKDLKGKAISLRC